MLLTDNVGKVNNGYVAESQGSAIALQEIKPQKALNGTAVQMPGETVSRDVDTTPHRSQSKSLRVLPIASTDHL